MFVKIIPFTKLPRKFEAFDYSVPREFREKIKIGHIVAIYFRGQKIYGAVEKISRETKILPEKIKPIFGLTEIILPKTLLQIASWASQKYLASSSLLYKLIIPLPPHQLGKISWCGGEPAKREGASNFTPEKKILSLNKLQAQNVIKILGNLAADKNNFFLYENDFKETLAVFIKIAQKELAQKKQILLLVPALEDTNNFSPYLNPIFGEKLIVWKGKLSAGEKFSLWQKISAGAPLIVLGTRPAVFLPFSDLSLILIYNSTSADLKQWDQNPRYDSREVAEKLQEVHGAKIVKSDILPDLNSWKELRGNPSTSLRAGKIIAVNIREPLAPFTIADIKKEKNISAQIFTFPLHQMISRGLDENKKIILFLNRREKNSLLFCADCRKTFSCPECSRPYGVDGGHFLCYHCGRKTDVPAECPDCRGTNLKTIATGMEGIKKIIAKEFPEARIEIATKNKTSASNFDILVATDYFWKNILPKIDVSNIYGAAIMDFDFYLMRPEFNQKETALLALHRFLHFTSAHNLQETLLQTAFPENELFSNPEPLYDNELRERQEFEYPPFGQLVKIICKEKNEAALERESQKLYANLLNAGFGALPPFSPIVKKRTKNYLKHVVIKEKLDKNLSDLKALVPDEYQIDINPISIY